MVAIRPCIERKQYITGVEERYNCQWLFREEHLGILKHVSEVEYQISGLTIKPGDVSYRFHWPNRSYNLCKWYNAQGDLLGNYFNLADSVTFADEEVAWRDLSIDILVLADGTVETFIGGKRPPLSQTWLHIYIEASKQDILRKYLEIIQESDQLMERNCTGCG